jgi:hypothetical protein
MQALLLWTLKLVQGVCAAFCKQHMMPKESFIRSQVMVFPEGGKLVAHALCVLLSLFQACFVEIDA